MGSTYKAEKKSRKGEEVGREDVGNGKIERGETPVRDEVVS